MNDSSISGMSTSSVYQQIADINKRFMKSSGGPIQRCLVHPTTMQMILELELQTLGDVWANRASGYSAQDGQVFCLGGMDLNVQVDHRIPEGEMFIVNQEGHGVLEDLHFSPADVSHADVSGAIRVDLLKKETEKAAKAIELRAKAKAGFLLKTLLDEWEQSDE